MPMMQAGDPSRIVVELAELGRTLGNAHRLVLLEHIAQGERAVEHLAELSGLSIANASQHLQHLKRAGMVQSRRDGKQVLYRLSNGPLVDVLQALRKYVEYTHKEMLELVADNFKHRDRLEAISRDELVERLKTGAITILDVRSTDEFALGHLPGAINIPAEDLAQQLTKLSNKLEIVAYCRGPFCVLSERAITLLASQGYRARRLDGGFPAWSEAGLPIESGD